MKLTPKQINNVADQILESIACAEESAKDVPAPHSSAYAFGYLSGAMRHIAETLKGEGFTTLLDPPKTNRRQAK